MRSKKKLDGLPCHKAGWFEGWYGWSSVAIVKRVGLDGMEAAERLVDKGDRLCRHLKEQRIVVAANGAVKRCELVRSEIVGVMTLDGRGLQRVLATNGRPREWSC